MGWESFDGHFYQSGGTAASAFDSQIQVKVVSTAKTSHMALQQPIKQWPSTIPEVSAWDQCLVRIFWAGREGILSRDAAAAIQLPGTPHLLKKCPGAPGLLQPLPQLHNSQSCLGVAVICFMILILIYEMFVSWKGRGSSPPPCSATQSRLRIHRLFPKAQTWTQTQGPGRACFDPWRGTQTVVPGIKLRSFTKIHLVLKQTVYYSQKSLISLITF